jgi:hypothetical protein
MTRRSERSNACTCWAVPDGFRRHRISQGAVNSELSYTHQVSIIHGNGQEPFKTKLENTLPDFDRRYPAKIARWMQERKNFLWFPLGVAGLGRIGAPFLNALGKCILPSNTGQDYSVTLAARNGVVCCLRKRNHVSRPCHFSLIDGIYTRGQPQR